MGRGGVGADRVGGRGWEGGLKGCCKEGDEFKYTWVLTCQTIKQNTSAIVRPGHPGENASRRVKQNVCAACVSSMPDARIVKMSVSPNLIYKQIKFLFPRMFGPVKYR